MLINKPSCVTQYTNTPYSSWSTNPNQVNSHWISNTGKMAVRKLKLLLCIQTLIIVWLNCTQTTWDRCAHSAGKQRWCHLQRSNHMVENSIWLDKLARWPKSSTWRQALLTAWAAVNATDSFLTAVYSWSSAAVSSSDKCKATVDSGWYSAAEQDRSFDTQSDYQYALA